MSHTKYTEQIASYLSNFFYQEAKHMVPIAEVVQTIRKSNGEGRFHSLLIKIVECLGIEEQREVFQDLVKSPNLNTIFISNVADLLKQNQTTLKCRPEEFEAASYHVVKEFKDSMRPKSSRLWMAAPESQLEQSLLAPKDDNVLESYLGDIFGSKVFPLRPSRPEPPPPPPPSVSTQKMEEIKQAALKICFNIGRGNLESKKHKADAKIANNLNYSVKSI